MGEVSAAMTAARAQQGESLEDDHPMFATDDFRMYCMKILPCAKRFVHDWVHCPFSHPGEKAKRRDPRYMVYTGIACPSMKKAGACPRGERCPYAHNVFEYWLHPTRYRTQLCNDGLECRRRVCFFAHSLAELRVPATKPFVPPEVLSALEGQPTTAQEAAAAGEALRRISSSWQAGSHRDNQQPPHVLAARGMEAAQIESRVLEHLYGNAPAEVAVQQLRAASTEALIGDASLQARLAGALQQLRRSRSADDGQDVLINMLQGMLSEAVARSQQTSQQKDNELTRQDSDSYQRTGSYQRPAIGMRPGAASFKQQNMLTKAGQVQELLAQRQAQLQASGSGEFTQALNGSGGSWDAELPQQALQQAAAWQQQQQARAPQLPQLRENHVLQGAAAAAFGGTCAASGASMAQGPASVTSSTSSFSDSGRPLTPSSAEAYSSWMAAHGYTDPQERIPEPQRRSLQQDARPTPTQGAYPRRRSLQVEDWRSSANPFARVSDSLLPDAAHAPVPLQQFVAAHMPNAYLNMFEGGGALVAVRNAFGVQQQPGVRVCSSAEMHFPSRWPVQHTMPRNSLDSHQPHQDPMFPRQSLDMLRPTSEAYAARLSLDNDTLSANSSWQQGGSTSRPSNAFSDTDLPGRRSAGPAPPQKDVGDVGCQFARLSMQQPSSPALQPQTHSAS